MDADTGDCAERRAAGQTMPIDVRSDVPVLNPVTNDLTRLGQTIGACRLFVQVGDEDGYERHLATHRLPPGDPDWPTVPLRRSS